VTPTEIGQTTTLRQGERTALSVGLQYATLLRAHFPEAYISIASRRMSFHQLYGVAVMFLTLAHQRLLSLDFTGLSIVKPTDPHYGFNWNISSAESFLNQHLKSWLELPLPKVYGIGSSLNELMPIQVQVGGAPLGARRTGPVEYIRQTNRHALALLLWWLVVGGPWAKARIEDLDEFAAQLPNEMGRAIRSQANLPLNVPLTRLCAELDRTKPHGLKELGSILAFVCGQTDNTYADWSPAEIRQRYDMAVDLDWRQPAAIFAEARAAQQQAKHLAGVYARLDRRVYADPELLTQIGQAIRDVAQPLRGALGGLSAPYRPGRLIHLLGEA